MPLSTITSGPTVVAAAGSPAADVEAVCGPAAPGYAQCLALRRTDVMGQSALTMSPLTVSPPFGPADIKSAYALPGGSAGSGLTVAVVDAFDLPTAEADLTAYRSQFGLPACTTANGCFRKVNQNGVAGSYPAVDPGWGQEIALDIDMVSAACPNCHILLVEASSSSMTDLGTSVNTAVSLGAVAVSNSYGGRESSSASLLDAAYYNHPGVAIVASTGDCGWNCSQKTSTTYYANVQYPASSPYVVAVGGTSLVNDGSARGWTESAWSGAGSGCSAYESKPSWQHDAGCGNRTQADVSAVADPDTGVFVYYNGNWYEFGGTSASSPIIASVFALAGGPSAGTYPASYLYSAAAGLNDVIGGNNDSTWGNCPAGSYLCNAVVGYDGPTGLGTPNGVGAFGWRQVPGKPTDVVATRGNASASVSWTAAAANGSTVTAYTVTASDGIHTCGWTTGALSCTAGGLTNGTPYTFTVTATNGVGTGPASLPSNSVTPATVPGPPSAVTAVLGNRSALVSWTASAANGSAVTAYTVTASDGIHTCGW
ncbi:MAG: fibronectin type III domain-containing protein, partial [Candidatus Limnocylindrales bacterium]